MNILEIKIIQFKETIIRIFPLVILNIQAESPIVIQMTVSIAVN